MIHCSWSAEIVAFGGDDCAGGVGFGCAGGCYHCSESELR